MHANRWPEVKLPEIPPQIIIQQSGHSKIAKLIKSLFLMSLMRSVSKSSMELYKEDQTLKSTIDFWQIAPQVVSESTSTTLWRPSIH